LSKNTGNDVDTALVKFEEYKFRAATKYKEAMALANAGDLQGAWLKFEEAKSLYGIGVQHVIDVCEEELRKILANKKEK